MRAHPTYLPFLLLLLALAGCGKAPPGTVILKAGSGEVFGGGGGQKEKEVASDIEETFRALVAHTAVGRYLAPPGLWCPKPEILSLLVERAPAAASLRSRASLKVVSGDFEGGLAKARLRATTADDGELAALPFIAEVSLSEALAGRLWTLGAHEFMHLPHPGLAPKNDQGNPGLRNDFDEASLCAWRYRRILASPGIQVWESPLVAGLERQTRAILDEGDAVLVAANHSEAGGSVCEVDRFGRGGENLGRVTRVEGFFCTSLADGGDGTLVLGGISGPGYFHVRRLSRTGVPDTTFAGDGAITFNPGGASYSQLRSLAVLADRSMIVVGGAVDRVTKKTEMAAYRLSSTGALSLLFLKPKGAYAHAALNRVVPTPDGGFLVAGVASGSAVLGGLGESDMFVSKYVGATHVWSTTVTFSRDVNYMSTLVVDSEGRPNLVGTTKSPDRSKMSVAVARLHPGGGLDATFGIGGKADYDWDGNPFDATDALLGPSGEVWVFGTVYSPSGLQIGLLALADGKPVARPLQPGEQPGRALYSSSGVVEDHVVRASFSADGGLFVAGGRIVFELVGKRALSP